MNATKSSNDKQTTATRTNARRVSEKVLAKQNQDSKAQRKRAGAWLRGKRSDMGYTQKQLADRLGLEYYTFVSQVENGSAKLSHYQWVDYASALEMEPKEFARVMMFFMMPEIHQMIWGSDIPELL